MCEEVKPVVGIRLNMMTERYRRGLTCAEVAKRLGTWSTTVSGWERGKSCPSSKYLVPLCELYGSTPSYLLHREGMED